jgi:hypothetical protein
MWSIYNYIFGYGVVKCCNCSREMTVKHPVDNILYSCSNVHPFEAFHKREKEKDKMNDT